MLSILNDVVGVAPKWLTGEFAQSIAERLSDNHSRDKRGGWRLPTLVVAQVSSNVPHSRERILTERARRTLNKRSSPIGGVRVASLAMVLERAFRAEPCLE